MSYTIQFVVENGEVTSTVVSGTPDDGRYLLSGHKDDVYETISASKNTPENKPVISGGGQVYK